MRKAFWIIAILVVLAVAGYGVYAWYLGSKSAAPIPVAPAAEDANTVAAGSPEVDSNGVPAPNAPAAPTNAPLTGEAKVKSVGKIASAFIERVGTYSSDANFSNITELYELMTPAYRRANEATVAKGSNGPKIVVTTRAIATAAKEEAPDRIVAVVTTQRERTQNSTTTRVYQTAKVELVEISGEWKVDSVTWAQENGL